VVVDILVADPVVQRMAVVVDLYWSQALVRSEVAAWGRWVAAGTESRAEAFRSHPLSAGPRDQEALALALRWEATNSSTPSAQSPAL